MSVHLWVPEATPEEHLALLPASVTVHRLAAQGELPPHLGRGDILVASFNRPRVLAAIPRLEGLRVVQTLSAGVDGLAGQVPAGVVLCDAAGVHDISVAEWVVMAILATYRELPRHLEAQRAARWSRLDHLTPDLEGVRVLVLGHGSIGRATETRLRPFGVEMLRIARRPREGVAGPEALDRMLPLADVVVVLLPLTAATRHIVDAGFLARMRPGALLVNAARGPVVDTDALTDAVLRGAVRAALDVTDPEPLPDGHPLWTAPGVIITPHVAGVVEGFPARAWRFVAEQVERFEHDEPLRNVVVDGY